MALILVVLVVILGAGAMLWLGRCFRHTVGWSANPYVARSLRYQPVAVLIGAVAVMATQVLVPDHADFLDLGDWSAEASGLGWLGVADGDSWVSVGLTFLVIMTVVTMLFMWLQVVRREAVSGHSLVRALPWAIAFSLTNAVAEELLFRVSVTEALAPAYSLTVVAATSAILFGVPHWLGTPGGPVGMLLAGFMGWFLAVAVVQTGGLGWALLIHGVQDVVIICVLIARASPLRVSV